MTTCHSPFKYGDVGCGVVWNFHAQLLMKLQSSNHQPKEALAYGPADRCPEYIPEVGAVKRYLHTVDFSLEVHDPVESMSEYRQSSCQTHSVTSAFEFPASDRLTAEFRSSRLSKITATNEPLSRPFQP